MNQYLLSLIFYVITLTYKTCKSLQMLQQNRYNRGNKYFKWLKQNIRKNYFNIELIGFLIPLLILIPNIAKIVFGVFYLIVAMYYIISKKLEQSKVPLNVTGRIKRMGVTILVIYALPIVFTSCFYCECRFIYYYIMLFILTFFNNIVVVICNYINTPIEKMVGLHFKRKATKKLNSMNSMKVIGVTGSYGKTSSKNILNDILNIKYNSFKTPKNYNTPNGLMITINDYLDKFNDYFIAEMGACKVHEIKELCDLVHPTYGIVTKIGVAHLETFGSEQNIINTKMELIESLPSDGVGILNMDDPKQVDYNIKNDCKIIWIGIDSKAADVVATNIKLNNNGTEFDCIFKGDKTKYKFSTKLLGRANVYNILAGIALGKHLGISTEELIRAVKKVQPVEHRLEMKKYYDMHMIDDAYNANPDGCKMALEVLSQMPGDRIVVSSGMIELGDSSYELNYQLGEEMSSSCVKVILIGENQTKPIYDGLISKKFKKENIYVLNNIMDAFDLIKKIKGKDTFILLQSDLPDIFNEK